MATKTSLTPSLNKNSEHRIPIIPPVLFPEAKTLIINDLITVGEYSAIKIKGINAAAATAKRCNRRSQNSQDLLTQKYSDVGSRNANKPTPIAGFILPNFSMTRSMRITPSGSDKLTIPISNSVALSNKHVLSAGTSDPVQYP